MSKRLTMVVNSCDSYADVWDLFFESVSVQWPHCEYDIVLNTETLTYSYKNMPITVHNYTRKFGRKDRWGERFRKTLSNINTPYVLTFLDDFVLTESVKKPELLEQIMDFMDENKEATVVYLDAFPKWCFILEEDKKLPGFGKMPQVCAYKLSTAVAVWRREKLLALIRDFESPWEWEMNASFRACRMQCGDFYAVVDAQEDIPRNIMFSFQHGGAVRRGLWNVDTLQLAKEYGIEIDTNKRGIMDSENPYNEVRTETYSVKANIRKDFFRVVFWKKVFLHGKIKWKSLVEKWRFVRSVW